MRAHKALTPQIGTLPTSLKRGGCGHNLLECSMLGTRIDQHAEDVRIRLGVTGRDQEYSQSKYQNMPSATEQMPGYA